MSRITATALASLVVLPLVIVPPADQPSVDAVSRASFTRVAGAEAGGAVLNVGAADGWMSQAVGTPTVTYEKSQYRMWFTGVRTTGPGDSPYLFRSEIGAATSPDGLRWQLLNDGRPVLPAGAPGTFDSLATGQPFVLRERGRYLMWYGGADGTQAPDSVRIERIGLAESSDGIRWQRLNGGRPVIDVGPPGSTDSTQATGPCIVRTSEQYLMWYGAFNGRHSIAAARSRDGVTWSRLPVTGLGDAEALGPSVYTHGGEFFMLYSVVAQGRWTMVAARSSNGLAWTPVNGGRPVLGPASPGSFGAGGAGQNHSVHPSKMLWDGRRLRVWYMAEAPVVPFLQRIGLMEARLDVAR